MMKRAALLVCGLLLASPAHAELIPGSDFSYKNWSGAAYTAEDTGAFSHCAVSASYVSGDELLMSVNADATVTVGVISATWRMTPGQSLSAKLTVDRRAPFFGTANALNESFAALVLPDIDAALTALKRGRTLVVETSVGQGVYDLTGTSRALDQTLNCALEYLEYGTQPAAPQKKEPQIQPPAPVAALDLDTLKQLAAILVADQGLNDITYLNAQEVRDILHTESVVWLAKDKIFLSGVFAEVGDNRVALSATDAADFNRIGSDCDGQFSTSVRVLTVAGLAARELSSQCLAGDSEQSIMLTKTQLDGMVLYTFMFFSEGSAYRSVNERSALSLRTAEVAVSALTGATSAPPARKKIH